MFAKQSHTIASQIVKQIILPELEKEVNTGKNFSTLRQIFNSLILASWYKKNLKEALLNQVYADKSTIKGNIANGAKQTREEIYEQYIKAYKKGVFNYIKDTETSNGVSVPRKYFSGGFVMSNNFQAAMITTDTPVHKERIFGFFRGLAAIVGLFVLATAVLPAFAQTRSTHGPKNLTPSPIAEPQTRPIMSEKALASRVKNMHSLFPNTKNKIIIRSPGKISLYTRVNNIDAYISLKNITGVSTPDDGKSLIITVLRGQGNRKIEIMHKFIYATPLPDDLLTINGPGFNLSLKHDPLRVGMEQDGYLAPSSSLSISRPRLYGDFNGFPLGFKHSHQNDTKYPGFAGFERALMGLTASAAFYEVEVPSKAMTVETENAPGSFDPIVLNMVKESPRPIGNALGKSIFTIPLNFGNPQTKEELGTLVDWAKIKSLVFDRAKLIYSSDGTRISDSAIELSLGKKRIVSVIGLSNIGSIVDFYDTTKPFGAEVLFVNLVGLGTPGIDIMYRKITIKSNAAMLSEGARRLVDTIKASGLAEFGKRIAIREIKDLLKTHGSEFSNSRIEMEEILKDTSTKMAPYRRVVAFIIGELPNMYQYFTYMFISKIGEYGGDPNPYVRGACINALVKMGNRLPLQERQRIQRA